MAPASTLLLPLSDSGSFPHYPLPSPEGKEWKHISTILQTPQWGPAIIHKVILSSTTLWAVADTPHHPHPGVLLECLEKVLGVNEEGYYRSDLLNHLASAALEVHQLFPSGSIPLLRTGVAGRVTLTRKQILCLLSLSFFNLLDDTCRSGEYNRFFLLGLYQPGDRTFRGSQLAKLEMLLNYFSQTQQVGWNGAACVSYERKVLNTYARKYQWSRSEAALADINVLEEGFIEDSENALHVDFANEYIGGGALDEGCVQEEIRFMVCPELIVSMLICERMAEWETIWIKGAVRYSNYTGYGSRLNFVGPFRLPSEEREPLDEMGRADVELVAMDAKPFGSLTTQCSERNIMRELTKSLCGFAQQNGSSHNEIATGNWGCGVFGGHPEVKAVIQWLSASVCGRGVVYYTFGDGDLTSKLRNLRDSFTGKAVCVGAVFKSLITFKTRGGLSPIEHIQQAFQS